MNCKQWLVTIAWALNGNPFFGPSPEDVQELWDTLDDLET